MARSATVVPEHHFRCRRGCKAARPPCRGSVVLLWDGKSKVIALGRGKYPSEAISRTVVPEYHLGCWRGCKIARPPLLRVGYPSLGRHVHNHRSPRWTASRPGNISYCSATVPPEMPEKVEDSNATAFEQQILSRSRQVQVQRSPKSTVSRGGKISHCTAGCSLYCWRRSSIACPAKLRPRYPLRSGQHLVVAISGTVVAAAAVRTLEKDRLTVMGEVTGCGSRMDADRLTAATKLDNRSSNAQVLP